MIDNVDSSIKVIVVGNGGVGKTSMLRRFCKGDFTGDYKKTVGTDFHEKNIFLSSCDQVVNMMLWDTAGQEVFDSITASYYRGAGACVLAFSCVDRDSFMAIERWKGKVEAQCGKNTVVMVLVKTKADLQEQATVTEEEAIALAKRLEISFYSTSTKDNLNVASVFEYLAETCMRSGAMGDVGNEVEIGGKEDRKNSSNSNGNGAHPSKVSSEGGSGAGNPKPSEATRTSNTVNISPNVQRAKKKKLFSCSIL